MNVFCTYSEALVEKVYRKAYQAHITSFFPFLLAIRNADGSLASGALNFRSNHKKQTPSPCDELQCPG